MTLDNHHAQGLRKKEKKRIEYVIKLVDENGYVVYETHMFVKKKYIIKYEKIEVTPL